MASTIIAFANPSKYYATEYLHNTSKCLINNKSKVELFRNLKIIGGIALLTLVPIVALVEFVVKSILSPTFLVLRTTIALKNQIDHIDETT